MNKDHQRFEVQDAPLKNTDKAFVKVNKDGSPDKGRNSQQDTDRSKKETIDTKQKGQDRR
jgi:hypothetical protein